jgi:two-component system response regulator ArlR
LWKTRNIVLTRDTLLREVWGFDYAGDTNVVDVYIRYLRSKIDQRFDTNLIRTVRGVGYILENE